MWSIRRAMYHQNTAEVAEMLISGLVATKNNEEFVAHAVKMFELQR